MASTTSGSGPSSTADTTATGQNTFTGGFGGSPTGASRSAAAARTQALALGFGRTYGLAMVLGGICGAFLLFS